MRAVDGDGRTSESASDARRRTATWRTRAARRASVRCPRVGLRAPRGRRRPGPHPGRAGRVLRREDHGNRYV